MGNLIAIIAGAIAGCITCAGACFKAVQLYNEREVEIRFKEPKTIEDIVIEQMKNGSDVEELDIKITIHHAKDTNLKSFKKDMSPISKKDVSPLAKKD